MKLDYPYNSDDLTPEHAESLIALTSATLLAISAVLFFINPNFMKGDVITMNLACLLYRREIANKITKGF